MNTDTWNEIISYLPVSSVPTILCVTKDINPKIMWKIMLERDYGYNLPYVKRGYSRLYKIYKTVFAALDLDYRHYNPFMVYAYCHKFFNNIEEQKPVVSLRALRLAISSLGFYDEGYTIPTRYVSMSDVENLIDQVSITHDMNDTGYQPGRVEDYDDTLAQEIYDPKLDAYDCSYELYVKILKKRKIPLVYRRNGLFKVVDEAFDIDLMKKEGNKIIAPYDFCFSQKYARRARLEEENYENSLKDQCPDMFNI